MVNNPSSNVYSPITVKNPSKIERENLWTNAEDQVLITEKNKGKGWVEISKIFEGTRTDLACRNRYYNYLSVDTNPLKPDEEKILLNYLKVKKGRKGDLLPNRSLLFIRQKLAILENKLSEVKGVPWSSEEDKKLRKIVDKIGKRWEIVALDFKPRTPQQCRSRYQNYADPSLKHEAITSEEEKLIVSMHCEGKKGMEIAKSLVGRTDIFVRRYLNSKKGKKRFEEYKNQNQMIVDLENNPKKRKHVADSTDAPATKYFKAEERAVENVSETPLPLNASPKEGCFRTNDNFVFPGPLPSLEEMLLYRT